MSKSYSEITKDLNVYLTKLGKDIPEVMGAFSQLAKSSTKDGALDKKTKELIALAIGIAVKCDGCIGFHVKALVNLGVTKEEIEEVCGVSVYMGGGPSLMYAADALRAYDDWTNKETN